MRRERARQVGDWWRARGAAARRRTVWRGSAHGEAAARPRAPRRSAVPVRRGPRPDPGVPEFLRSAAGWAWRLLVLGVAAYAVFALLERFQPVAVAVFLGLVVAALLRPVADLLNRWMPRGLAVLGAYLLVLLLAAGLLAGLGFVVADQASRVGAQFDTGVTRVEHWLEGAPFHVRPGALTGLQSKVSALLSAHRSTLVQSAVRGAAQAVEVATIAALGLFCSVFFTYSGERMWAFVADQLPAGRRDGWQRGGRAAWRTLSGYIRGIILVAGTNAVLVAIALFVLHVPLTLPLAVLEFIATFVPLIGSPIALLVASVVALATRGPVTAAAVLVLIVVIGQIEGHLLQPLIMGWAVRLHPVVVAVSVIAGSIALGVIGALVAVPAVSVVWAVLQALRHNNARPTTPQRGPASP
ncbi:AI-2E family transporter [Streptacidiphilus sp. P02-A3a]|uniref:AI-2E family transporter n=1 Tax=Streptacidiphilus sp. P02-A3a TaxID=2704468 RepID=UPI0015F9EFA1|nr:AI-2E family transporter [Streptacidiphilus sp. P02-A3a]QMU69867.1 AI-2E family transporter [Streptacidiphilus sp. P02-A3a]